MKYQQNEKFIAIEPCVSIGMERTSRRLAMEFSVTYSNKREEDTKLPHLDLVERCGSMVENLWSQNNWLNISIETSQTPYELDMERGYFMDHLFNKCPNMKNFTITDIRLNQCDPNNTCISNSLTRLTMCNTILSKDALPELSSRLPSLKVLTLNGCETKDLKKDADGSASTNDYDRYDTAVDMQNSSLDSLSVSGLKTILKRISVL